MFKCNCLSLLLYNFPSLATGINTIGNGGGLTMVDPDGNEVDVMPTPPSNLTVTPANPGRGPRLSKSEHSSL